MSFFLVKIILHIIKQLYIRFFYFGKFSSFSLLKISFLFYILFITINKHCWQIFYNNFSFITKIRPILPIHIKIELKKTNTIRKLVQILFSVSSFSWTSFPITKKKKKLMWLSKRTSVTEVTSLAIKVGLGFNLGILAFVGVYLSVYIYLYTCPISSLAI